uniref:Uncharacterized protein n=1 Tax=Entomoneis paludosa TaxID=265537 RepID=A0A7S2Y1J8_9STRA|mmetsp:Transcript_11286/g.23100  ORF Transcript_11286/g.23100 Transcript_11286/m.23100 type:complete len:227 (+) Transcript_11286:224-904(+)
MLNANHAHFSNQDSIPRVLELDLKDTQHMAQAVAASRTQRGYHLILASDVTYNPSLHEPLAQAIAALLWQPESPSRQYLSKGGHKSFEGGKNKISEEPTRDTQIELDAYEAPEEQEAGSNSTNSLMMPRCLVSHEERLLNTRGEDYQLLQFEQAVATAGLKIAKVSQYERTTPDDDKIHKVSILEIVRRHDPCGSTADEHLAHNEQLVGRHQQQLSTCSPHVSSSR